MTATFQAGLLPRALLFAMFASASAAWAQPLPPSRPASPSAPAAQPAPATQSAPPAASTQQPASAPADADEEAAPSSQPTQNAKCETYRKSFDGAVNRLGKKGLGQEFLDRNAAFIASNCAGERNVCPRSPEELRVANVIVMQAVSGTGGTFMPFACRKE
ncbi:hypothetical protein [Terrarubrum flagellatum]|uniref:hypothetical protein n=1 Tax=Terrirubrum flagellatum TaxID=2895980 RepID=UPI0031454709